MQLARRGFQDLALVQGLQALTVRLQKLHETSLSAGILVAARSVIQQRLAYYVPNRVLLLNRLGT